jgi:pimeloyl-ACP methyl ester carboxylesterase
MSIETIDVGGISVELRREGAGPALLVLHGADGLLFSAPLLRELTREFEVLAPHHPGWGGSDLPGYFDSVSDIAELYTALVESLGVELPVLGLSFGGWVAAQMAATCRHRLTQLILVAPLGIKLGDRETRDFADIYIADRDALPAIWYGDPAKAPLAELATFDDEDFLYLARAQEALARYCWQPYMHDPKLRHRLQRIEVPTLVVHGSNDRLVLTPRYYEQYASLIGPNAETRVIAGAGHRVEEEAPESLAAEVKAFVQTSARLPVLGR